MTDHTLMRRAAEVWRGLTEAFGEKFQTVYGQDPAPIWVSAIATLTDEQCRIGVEAMKMRLNRTFPCNLTEFETACRANSQSRPHHGGGSGAISSPARSYAAVARPEIRDQYLARVRARLSGNATQREPGTGPGEG